MSKPFNPRKDDALKKRQMASLLQSADRDSLNEITPETRSPFKFFLLVFALSVPFWLLGASSGLQLLPGLPVSALAFVCPATAAAILMYREQGPAGVLELLKRSLDYERIPAIWYVPILLLIPGVTISAYELMRFMKMPLPAAEFPLVAALVMSPAFFIGALGEELGWSGYVLDPLQQRWNALQASVLLGLVWAAWHLIPLVQAHRSAAWIAWWSLFTVSSRVLMTWLYNNTGRSVFAAALYHAISNLSWQLFPNYGSHWDPRMIGLIVVFAAGIVTLIWGWRTLTGYGRQDPGSAARSRSAFVIRILIVIFLFLVTSAVGIYALFARDLSAARGRLIGHSKTMHMSFGTLEYALMGEGEPVLIIHGAGGGFDQGLDVTGDLAAHGYRLIAPSRFGYLASTLPPKPTTAAQADAYAELLDTLGIDRAPVIGISAGEWSALQFAIRYPKRCKALVLIGPANYLPPNQRNHGGPLVRLMIGSDFITWATLKLMHLMPGTMARQMIGTDPALVRAAEPREKARVGQILDHLLPMSARFRGMQFDIKTAAAPEPYAIEKIACPVLTISARDDLFGTAARAQYIAANVPEGKVVIYPTGGHALIGHQAGILREIESFFAGLRSFLF